MTRYLTLEEVIIVHDDTLTATGGSPGIRDRGLLESCVAQPQMTFSGQELYSTIADKAAALGFLLVSNHAFVDGNKRVGYVFMRLFLQMNGYDLAGDHNEKEAIILALAASTLTQEEFFAWVQAHVVPLGAGDNQP